MRVDLWGNVEGIKNLKIWDLWGIVDGKKM